MLCDPRALQSGYFMVDNSTAMAMQRSPHSFSHHWSPPSF